MWLLVWICWQHFWFFMHYNLAVFLVRVVVTQSVQTCGFWYGFVCSIFGFSCIFYNLAVFLVRVVVTQ